MSADRLPLERVTQRILVLREQKVLLDADLAALYGVPTKRFNEQVRRNLDRFPADFMFQLDQHEFDALSLRSQNATSSETPASRGGRRYRPYVFTEHGAIMAAAILNSPRAVEVSVYVVRAFVKLRELLATHGELAERLAGLERSTEALAVKQDAFAQATRMQLRQVFEAIRELMEPPQPAGRPIGFVALEESPAGKKKPGRASC